MIKGFFFLMYVQSLVDQFKFLGASCVNPLHSPLHSSLHFYVAPTEVSRTYSIAGYVTAADQPGLGWDYTVSSLFEICKFPLESRLLAQRH